MIEMHDTRQNLFRSIGRVVNQQILRILQMRTPVKLALLLFVLTGFSIACTDDGFGPSITNADAAYWELRLNYPAAQLSLSQPYNTLQLEAVAYRTDGAPISDDQTSDTLQTKIVWTSGDSSKVRVSPQGVILAIKETDRVFVFVRRTIGKITHTDSAWIRVKDAPERPVLTTFSIRPTDSLKRAAFNLLSPYMFPVTAFDSQGHAMTGLPVRWKSSNTKVARVSSYSASNDISGAGWFDVLDFPQAVISASTWVYGVVKSDSFTLEVGWQIFFPVRATGMQQLVNRNGEVVFGPIVQIVDIGPGGSAEFQNRTGFGPVNVVGRPAREGVPLDIIFDDPTIALPSGGFPSDTSGVGGNIIDLPNDTTLAYSTGRQYRRFVVPGEHFFTIQPFGVRGSIRVHDK